MSLPAAEIHFKAPSSIPIEVTIASLLLAHSPLDLSQRNEQPITAQDGSHRWRRHRRL
jgi:hypothetical protein